MPVRLLQGSAGRVTGRSKSTFQEFQPEPLWRTTVWLVGKEELSLIWEQRAYGSRIEEYFQNCKSKPQIQKGRRSQRRMSGKVTRPGLQETEFNDLERKAAISRAGPITRVCPELPDLWLKQGLFTLAPLTFWTG